MSPAAIALAIQLIQLAVQEEPAVAALIQQLFANGIPTNADFETLIAKIKAETYESIVTNTDLPKV